MRGGGTLGTVVALKEAQTHIAQSDGTLYRNARGHVELLRQTSPIESRPRRRHYQVSRLLAFVMVRERLDDVTDSVTETRTPP